MKNVRISVELGITVNLGENDFLKPLAGIAFDIPDGADLEEEYEKAWQLIKEQIKKRTKEQGEGHGAKLRERRRHRQIDSGY